MVSGNPIRASVRRVDRESARKSLGLDFSKQTLLVFGGSQGAHAINEHLLSRLTRYLARPSLQILWQTGPRDHSRVRAATANSPQIRVLPYLEDIGAAYSAIDLAVCRAGSTTLAELAALGVPSILIPFARAAEQHQAKNAGVMAEAGGAIVVSEEDLPKGELERALFELLDSPSRLEAMGESAKQLAHPDAAATIVSKALELV